MKQIKIGAITIGQAPRTDITRDILPLLPDQGGQLGSLQVRFLLPLPGLPPGPHHLEQQDQQQNKDSRRYSHQNHLHLKSTSVYGCFDLGFIVTQKRSGVYRPRSGRKIKGGLQ